ncbi:MAG: hypothetical protein INR66_23360 [Gordonia polyisoprenivorans]|nr:hypothetical protein [Gordonia polyisoprenivorans]
MNSMDHSCPDDSDLEARLREELARHTEPVEPSQSLRTAVDRLADARHPTSWSRWRGPVIAAAAVATIATLTSLVLVSGGQNSSPSGGGSSISAEPFAPEPAPTPELELDPTTAVTYSNGDHGTPSDDFRALGEKVADALQSNDLRALSALQDPESQQPNLMAGLIQIYGGKPVEAVEYMESSIRAFPFADVDYAVQCAKGRDVRFSLRFNYINGRLVLFPVPQEDLYALESGFAESAASETRYAASAASMPMDLPAPGTMRYPSCSR